MRCLGVDPGLSGALAWFDTDKPRTVHVIDTPCIDGGINSAELAKLLHEMPVDCAVIEKVHAYKGSSGKSAFTFGGAYWAVRQALVDRDVPILMVLPNKWKGAFGLRGQDKDASRAKATLYWPESSTLFKRKCDDGRAEAAIIARWGAYNWEKESQGHV